LAKIERGGTRKTSTHRPTRIAKGAHPPIQSGTAAQSKNKPAKFSYHPPEAGGKGTGNGGRGITAARGIFAESGSSLPLTVQGNTVHGSDSNGIIFAFGQTGTITGNTVSGNPAGIDLFNPGAAVKVTSNAVNGGNSGIGLSSASGAVVQTNTITAITGTALKLDESTCGGINNVTRNSVNDANCGISKGNAASSDVYLPNVVINVVSTQCQ